MERSLVSIGKGMLVLVILFSLSLSLFADTDTKEMANPSKELETLELAAKMSDYGYQRRDPILIAKAALMMAQVGPRKIEAEVVELGGDKAAAVEVPALPSPIMDVATMLKDAGEMASKDAAVLALVNDYSAKVKTLQGTQTKGAYWGPYSGVGIVSGYSSYPWRIDFEGNIWSEVRVIGNGNTDLDLFVFSGNGSLIASDTGWGDNCCTQFIPFGNQTITVVVKNKGPIPNSYRIFTD